ncbi:MAG TPA: polyketide cyclase [Gammaproteobacteria bacterium]|jgi:uncharacterized protein YndB with AHSA1/START domain|nr:SRPBCC domain-containing protein [Gammaproteobacteria bacterium]MDP6733141.1 SRPBCC domain-containing protein [Gammaproteobacteria bacterium]HAJ74989.1 polyketide cyclase [Gammaproteobacteria bacterium]|tara:strand:+ start:5437 stop:5892 length:456 start_codon:yes stop_codon:yes gene_type:complete
MNIEALTAKAKILIRRTPSDVFTAFVDASAMSKFWFTRKDNGLVEGESVTWFIGNGADATSFDIFVKELNFPNKLVVEWENGDEHTQVTWIFEETKLGDTVLTIEETGFTGSSDGILERALDSTGGFNQVIVAAKAFIEYDIALNLVADHA